MIKTTNYNEVGFRHTKSGKCSVCGKQASRTKHFYQTINPFNKDKDGNIKDGGQIWKELDIECKRWQKEPVIHARCEEVTEYVQKMLMIVFYHYLEEVFK